MYQEKNNLNSSCTLTFNNDGGFSNALGLLQTVMPLHTKDLSFSAVLAKRKGTLQAIKINLQLTLVGEMFHKSIKLVRR